jgi:hypothetical protein
MTMKKLKDWTLWEVKEFCSGKDCCKRCPFVKNDATCGLAYGNPSVWGLTDPPRFTEQEVEDAKVLMRMHEPWWHTLTRDSAGVLFLMDKHNNGVSCIKMRTEAFPSVRNGETVSLKEIAGCEDD